MQAAIARRACEQVLTCELVKKLPGRTGCSWCDIVRLVLGGCHSSDLKRQCQLDWRARAECRQEQSAAASVEFSAQFSSTSSESAAPSFRAGGVSSMRTRREGGSGKERVAAGEGG
eukprot:6176059-Pleurochrysis_carterae.AAC.1